MAKDITSNNFAKEVISLMKDYTDDVEDALDEKVETLGKQGAEELRLVVLPNASESGTANPSNRRAWKNYSKSWEAKFDKGTNYSLSVIRNKKYYSLTHLLEYGHATKDGKRTRAFKHVKPVSDKLEKQLLEDAKKIIEKGGKK